MKSSANNQDTDVQANTSLQSELAPKPTSQDELHQKLVNLTVARAAAIHAVQEMLPFASHAELVKPANDTLQLYISDVEDYITTHYTPKTEQQPKKPYDRTPCVACVLPDGSPVTVTHRRGDHPEDGLCWGCECPGFRAADNTEQQAVGWEDVQQPSLTEITAAKLVAKLQPALTNDQVWAVAGLISSHYIPKEALRPKLEDIVTEVHVNGESRWTQVIMWEDAEEVLETLNLDSGTEAKG